MEPVSKKIRGNDELASEVVVSPNTSSASSSASIVETFVEFPSLVFEVCVEFFPVNLLKTCRLVCKGWNEAACSVLRTRSCVKLLENNNKRSEDLKNLLVNRAFGPSSLPSPFQNLHVSGTFFSDECFRTLVHMPNVVVTTLQVLLMRNMDQRQLASFLVAKGGQFQTLTVLVPEANDGFTLDAGLMCNSLIKLTELRRLRFSDVCPRNCKHFELIKKLILHSSLEEIEFSFRDSSLFAQILTIEDLQTVRTLKVNAPTLLPDDSSVSVFGILRMPSLTELAVHVRDANEGSFRQFASLVGNVSGTLKILTSNLIRMELLPPCPQLRKIVLFKFESKVSEFSVAKFPALKIVNIRRLVASWRILENDFIPHTGVTKVIVSVLGLESEQKSFAEDSLHIFLTSLSRQFPNAQDLTLGINPFSSRTFRDIHYAFPGLKSLGISSQSDFSSMAGMKIEDVHHYLKQGWPVENIPRRNSIFDFGGLESVDLSAPQVTITNDMIIYCLAKIATLKTLEFCWNRNLSAQEIRDNLGHLEKISVVNSSNKEFSQVMNQLESMPNVQLL